MQTKFAFLTLTLKICLVATNQPEFDCTTFLTYRGATLIEITKS